MMERTIEERNFEQTAFKERAMRIIARICLKYISENQSFEEKNYIKISGFVVMFGKCGEFKRDQIAKIIIRSFQELEYFCELIDNNKKLLKKFNKIDDWRVISDEKFKIMAEGIKLDGNINYANETEEFITVDYILKNK